MPRRSTQGRQIENLPPMKLRRLEQRSSRSRDFHICNLPNEILEKIVGYLNFWHRPRLRKSCRRMRHICDSVLLHEFQSSIYKFSSKDPDGYEYASLMAIKDATWPYVLSGFESIFCGTILPLIWNNTKFSPEPEKIKSFLKQFYKLVDETIGDSYSQFSRLLYCVTLMGLLKKFKNCRLLASNLIPPNYWRIVLELRGPWVGILWSSKSAAESQERSKLLMILCEIMIADCTHRAFKYVEVGSKVVIYICNFNEVSCTISNLDKFGSATAKYLYMISAPTKVVTLLKSCLEDTVVQWPGRLPKNEFMVLIDIACKEALRWGCSQVHHIEIGPYFDANFDEAEEELCEDDLISKTSTTGQVL